MPADPILQPAVCAGFRGADGAPAVESVGEALLGTLLDRAHLIPPRLVGPLVAQEARAAGCTDVAIYLQDYDQVHLQPLTGPGLDGQRTPIEGTSAGRAFTSEELVEREQPDGSLELFLPMLDGSDRVGVLALRLPGCNDADRRLAQRLAGLVADLIVTKHEYTDTFAQVRTARPMSLAAQLQWTTLPPLTMTTPDVALAGIVEPAYEVGGDAFDYALNEHVLHFCVLDAMGHGLLAAAMSTVMVAAYRHGRRSGLPLAELYAAMDRAVAASFPGRFATAQFGQLDTDRGELAWINAGHPAPLRVREGRVIGELTAPVTRPVGFRGAEPRVQTVRLQPNDRVLWFTDGVVEERLDGRQFGEARLREVLQATCADGLPAAETVRRLSHTLMTARRGRTSDDASLLLGEWRGAPPQDELSPDLPESTPTDRG